jgi:hypothetical protein
MAERRQVNPRGNYRIINQAGLTRMSAPLLCDVVLEANRCIRRERSEMALLRHNIIGSKIYLMHA